MKKNIYTTCVVSFFLFFLVCVGYVDAISAPTISLISPSSGSVNGGTNVTISGGNFSKDGTAPNITSFTKVWFVSVSGNDTTGNGTQGNPYASLNKAVNMAANGDGIYVTAGTYRAIPAVTWETYTSACIFDLGKDLKIFGQNMDTVIQCYGSDAVTTRDAHVFVMKNSNSVVSNMKIDFYPNRGASYSNAVFQSFNGQGTVYRNLFVENKSTSVSWSYVYDNNNLAFNVYNSIFKSNGRSTTDYSGAPVYKNCLFDMAPSNGTRTYSLTRAITSADWDVNAAMSSDLVNAGDIAITNPNGSRSHIGVSGGMYAWKSMPLVSFGGTSAASVNFVDSNTLIATTSAHVPATVDVAVTNADGQIATSSGGYTYAYDHPAPTISSVSPTHGPINGGLSVTINGSNFRNGDNSASPDVASFAKVWYVNTSGNDTTGNGTQAYPYASLNKAVSMAANGDGIYIASGTYRAIPTSVNSTYSSACISDFGKNLKIFGQNMDTIIQCYGSDASATRDGNALGLQNSDSVLSNMKIDFYPSRGVNYSDAIFNNNNAGRSTYRNLFVENKSATVSWSYGYDNGSLPFNVYNSIFKSNGRSTTDYSGAPVYKNCLFDVTPSHGTKTSSLTRAITSADWGGIYTVLPSDLANSGDVTITNPNGSRSHIGVLGGMYAWGAKLVVTFGGLNVNAITSVNENALTVSAPNHTAGPVDIVVINPDTQTASLAGSFVYDNANQAMLTTQSPSSIIGSGATGNGTITDSGGENPTRQIEWGIASGSYTNSCSAGTGGIGAYTCAMTGLTPQTTYYVRSKAINSAGIVYGSEISFTTAAFTCGVDTVSKNGITYGTVIAEDDRCWLDRNLGATQVSTAGWYFQWGRDADGHQIISPLSGTTTTLGVTDAPGHANFIKSASDWRSPQNNSLWQGENGINNPCPANFHVPVQSEWTTWVSKMSPYGDSQLGGSKLKLAGTGSRSNSSGTMDTSNRYYWTSTVTGVQSVYFFYNGYGGYSVSVGGNRATGLQVRCINNLISTPTITTSPASNLTPISVTLNANLANTGGENPTREIQYGTATATYTNSCVQGAGSTGTYSCTLTNLIPNTTYYYRAKAVNSAGTSYGTELSFTTQALPSEVTIPNPDTSKISNATTNAYFNINQGTKTNTNNVRTNTRVKLTATNVEVVLPTNTTVTEMNNNSFNFTNFQTTNITQQIKQFVPSLAAVKVGVPNVKMTFSQPITITLAVDNAYDGRVLNVLYQEDGESTWSNHTTCAIVNGSCTFTTTHATTYTVNGDGTISGAGQNDITTDVQDVLSLDCDQTGNTNDNIVEFNELTPGTPVVGSTTCTVVTNSDQGYTLAVKRNDSDTTMDKDADAGANIMDRTIWDALVPNATVWSVNDTGLAFTIYSTTATKNISWWGTGATVTDANNKYAGFPTNYTDIMQHTEYNEVATTINIGYKLNVPTTQKSGTYSGDITYQVVTAP